MRPAARVGERRALKSLAPLLALVVLCAASADDPAERLADPVLEQRARGLFQEIRCLQCQNQSIDESDADLAEDLRKIIRSEILQGRSDAEIKRFIVARYGEFALERPSLTLQNALLWGAPFAVLFGGGAIFLLGRRGNLAQEVPLSADEEAALARLASTGPDQPLGQGSAAIGFQEKTAGRRRCSDEAAVDRRA